MLQTLAPGIVVLNKKYFTRDTLSAAQVGASSFTFSVLRVLLDAHILSGIVLYSRDEALSEAHCMVEDDWQGIPVVTAYFHFRMAQSTVASALKMAFEHTATRGTTNIVPIVYYQTDTLLQFHPHGYQFCVTHHGPFVAHFTEQFSPDLAILAFGGDSIKVDILGGQQQSGIRRLLQDKLGTVLAHSGLQQRVLEEEGLSPKRFKRLRPPIGVPATPNFNILPTIVQAFVADAEILLFTAVARLDYFKNVDLLVQSGVKLLEKGLPTRILVVGDSECDDTRRQALLDTVPVDLREHFLIVPRLSKDRLYALFSATRRNGIFLCPSRYETLGITPLEAAASGVTTIMTETPNVEALTFMPPMCRVAQDSGSIANRIEQIYQGGIPNWANIVKNHVRSKTSLEGFASDLLQAWTEMTAARRSAVPVQSVVSARKRMPSLATSYLSGTFMDMLRHSPLSPVPILLSP